MSPNRTGEVLTSTAYVVVTVLAAAMVAFSAGAVFLRASWVVQNLIDYGVPRSWCGWLGAAKAAGAAGLLVGLFVPIIGVALVLMFAAGVVA